MRTGPNTRLLEPQKACTKAPPASQAVIALARRPRRRPVGTAARGTGAWDRRHRRHSGSSGLTTPLRFPIAGVVPRQRQRRDGQVGPAIGDAEVPEIDVPAQRPSSSIRVFGAHASPWHTTSGSTGRAIGHPRPGNRRAVATGSASCSRRRPAPMARAAARGSRHPRRDDGRAPGQPAVCSQPAPAPSTCGTRT